MRGLFEQLLLFLEAGEKASLTSVIGRSGSVPAPAGSKLLVDTRGATWGTVGGGQLEAEVFRAAVKALEQEIPAITRLEFDASEAAGQGMLCGGRVSLFTEVVFPTRTEIAVFRTLNEELSASRDVALATAVVTRYREIPPEGTRLLFNEKRVLAGSLAGPRWNDKLREAAAGLLDSENTLYLQPGDRLPGFPGLDGFLVEPCHADPALVIFGAGHVAQPLCKMAALAGFRVTVVDDRAEFASRERFPDAAEILVLDPGKAFDLLRPGPRHYLVSVTRGHLEDRKVIEEALQWPAAYLGMIGSKRKVKLLWEDLKARGMKTETLERIHAPIGLQIGADTPAEIAVSILAEMIRTRRGSAGKPVILTGTLSLGDTPAPAE